MSLTTAGDERIDHRHSRCPKASDVTRGDGESAVQGRRRDEHVARELRVCVAETSPPSGDGDLNGENPAGVCSQEAFEPALERIGVTLRLSGPAACCLAIPLAISPTVTTLR